MSGDRRKSDRRIHPRDAMQVMPLSFRRDLVRICAVEIAIRLQDRVGTRAAADYLKEHMVRLDVALRVLLQPGKRRRYSG